MSTRRDVTASPLESPLMSEQPGKWGAEDVALGVRHTVVLYRNQSAKVSGRYLSDAAFGDADRIAAAAVVVVAPTTRDDFGGQEEEVVKVGSLRKKKKGKSSVELVDAGAVSYTHLTLPTKRIV